MSSKSDYEYLDEERRKLWSKLNTVETETHKRIDQVNEDLNKKASDYTDEARQYSKKTSEFKNKSEEAKNIILKNSEESSKKLDEINEVFSAIQVLNVKIVEDVEQSSANNALVKEIHDNIESRKTIIDNYISQIEDIFEDSDSLIEKVEKIQTILTESDDTSAKIETLYKSLLSRKKEIDQIYLDIFGYNEKDEKTGEETIVDGLIKKLEKSYEEIDLNLKKVETGLTNLQTQSTADFKEFSAKNESEFNKTLNDWNIRYGELSNKIKELLPKALTTGLSYAYSEKKEAEIKEYSKFNSTFKNAIWGLVGVSLIPFIISLISIYKDKPWDKALLDMPRLVLSILPLYIPVLWVAYSSSKKMNLSKRLSEEYSHKEVLSKTYEGLSTQINNITDEGASIDLRYKLLYNILEVSSENPGKLISDYNKSDHPLMDALDKSVKLTTAFEKIEKIPGLSKLAKILDKKSKTILEDENEKANKGLNTLEDDES